MSPKDCMPKAWHGRVANTHKGVKDEPGASSDPRGPRATELTPGGQEVSAFACEAKARNRTRVRNHQKRSCLRFEILKLSCIRFGSFALQNHRMPSANQQNAPVHFFCFPFQATRLAANSYLPYGSQRVWSFIAPLGCVRVTFSLPPLGDPLHDAPRKHRRHGPPPVPRPVCGSVLTENRICTILNCLMRSEVYSLGLVFVFLKSTTNYSPIVEGVGPDPTGIQLQDYPSVLHSHPYFHHYH